MQEAADEAARAVAGQIDPATLQPNFGTEQGAIWVMLGVATVNVILGVWRPRFTNLPD
ncbi:MULTISPECIES: hypothetical protein [unclassified Bradyrhizobium]|uniref:hypothetical protein n=1 Tax=unclassified Bradyrhizobium TaxID=2631580 RepID=UPI0028ED682F|nr:MULTISPECIES: hypothetical protein [unclassified Bradyrhizobium]